METPPLADEKLGFEQLKLLFDYTKFHIGAYMTLAGIVVAALNGKVTVKYHLLLWLSLVLIAIAGAAGGVVASNLPYHSALGTFAAHKIGPWRWAPMKSSSWMTLEHLAFWAALAFAVAAFAVPR